MNNLMEHLQEEVLLCDGAMGSRVQQADLSVEVDFRGKENCTEVLNLSRPDIVREIHVGYIAAGADIVLTNSFGASQVTLDEFGLANESHNLNKRAGELAHEAIEMFSKDGRSRYVLGSIGPGTKLPTLGQIEYDDLEHAISVQAKGLLDGEVDGFMIETVQDVLQLKAAVNGVRLAINNVGRSVPICCQITIETTGTMLVGSDIAAAATVLDALEIPTIGLNCATGPLEMMEPIKWLKENWAGKISVQPNAGLPELVNGETVYPLTPEEMAFRLGRFVRDDGVNLIGGCCGTVSEHIKAMHEVLLDIGGGRRPRPAQRNPKWVPSIASLYSQIGYRQENAYLSIGERCNANGSRRFRDLQAAENWEGCVSIGKEQIAEGSNAIDICTAYVGRDEVYDMNNLVERMRGSVNGALVIDSTEYPVLEAAIKRCPGKPIINSINLEDGDKPARERLRLARRFGCGIIALTIDEKGMAKTAVDKLSIATRIYKLAVEEHGLAPNDLIFDPLTFTICTGNSDDRRLGIETLKAIRLIATEMPECQIILGLSNISFGLKPEARHVLNSVFLDHALKAGMTGAILHFSKIISMHAINKKEVAVAEDLIFDKRSGDYDPLHTFIGLFQDKNVTETEKAQPVDLEDRLRGRIVDGDKQGLEGDLGEALKKYSPLDIINVYLLDGMKTVGELFGSGKMQLPFVLQSAEVMKAAVAYLEPYMDRVKGRRKGTIVLATVKGDVHDIGKNLVDIILTNNGYDVVNLGIKQPINNIIAAVREHDADAVGMSGLLVKSAVIMRENLEEMASQKVTLPVMLGGAALTRKYVEQDCDDVYSVGDVAYARDAFDGLELMKLISNGDFADYVLKNRAKRRFDTDDKVSKTGKAVPIQRPMTLEEITIRREELGRGIAIPAPPFWGDRIVENISVRTLLPFLNERMLYQFHWGFRKMGRRLEEYMEWAKNEVKPILLELIAASEEEDILRPQAVYGYWKAASDGDHVVLFDASGTDEVGRFQLPRQNRAGGLCIADFFVDVNNEERDVIGLQAVTIGQHASDVAREWFSADRYKDYLYLHGLGVEMAEALAEYVHKRIRFELGFSEEDSSNPDDLLRQGYRGSRYSFGYPACPNLADQSQILDLLKTSRIGLAMGEEDQLEPEQSTSAIIVHHPQAKYFSV